MTLTVAVPRETVAGERRVAITPDAVGRLQKLGLGVVVEAGAGLGAYFDDEAYRKAGAKIEPGAESLWQRADLLVKVQPPTPAEAGRLKEGAVLVSFLVPGECGELLRVCAQRKVSAFSLNLLPRTTRAQNMDALSSMSTIAGYKAVLLAAEALPKFFPMLVTAAGTIVPAKALILGVGVAGLQAIATARRLGAVVSAFDVRRATKEQVESLGAKFLELELSSGGEGAGGYAKELSAEDKKRTEELVAKNVGDADFVITTAQVPGKKAPRLIAAETVKTMRPGSVIVDLAAEQGGNCELTRAGEVVELNGVKILGPVNIFATMPIHASQMFARNVCAFVQNILGKDGSLNLDFGDEITAGSCASHAGELKTT